MFDLSTYIEAIMMIQNHTLDTWDYTKSTGMSSIHQTGDSLQ